MRPVSRLDEAERDACAYAEGVGGAAMLQSYLRGHHVPGYRALVGDEETGALLAASPQLRVRAAADTRVASTQWVVDRTVAPPGAPGGPGPVLPFHAPWLGSDTQEDVMFGGFRELAALGDASPLGREAARALAALHHAVSLKFASLSG